MCRTRTFGWRHSRGSVSRVSTPGQNKSVLVEAEPTNHCSQIGSTSERLQRERERPKSANQAVQVGQIAQKAVTVRTEQQFG